MTAMGMALGCCAVPDLYRGGHAGDFAGCTPEDRVPQGDPLAAHVVEPGDCSNGYQGREGMCREHLAARQER